MNTALISYYRRSRRQHRIAGSDRFYKKGAIEFTSLQEKIKVYKKERRERTSKERRSLQVFTSLQVKIYRVYKFTSKD